MIASRRVGAADSASAIPREGPVDAGEYLIAFVARSWDSDADPVSMPGWERLGDSAGTGNEWTPVARIFTRRAGADEPDSWPVDAQAGVTAVVIASTGVDTADPLAGVASFAAGGGSSGTAPSVTPDTAPAQVLWLLVHQNWNGAADTVVSWTGTDGIAGAIAPVFVNVSVAYADRDNTAPTGSPGWSINPWNGNTDALTAGIALRAATDEEPNPEPEPDPDPDPDPGPDLEAPPVPAPTEPPGPSRPAPAPPALVVDAPASSWLFGIGPAREGGITHELPQTTGRKLSVKLTEPSEASVEIDGRDPMAIYIDELATDLHVLYRRSPADARQQLYRGRIGKASDQIDATSHRLSVPSLDYRGVLKRRYLFTGTQQTWTNVEQTAIGWGLITQTQGVALGGDLGITDGSAATGRLRDRTYDLGDEIGTRLQELSEVLDGFDWDIVPVDSRVLEYRTWYPQRGADRNVLIELGGAATELSRDVDSGAYANAIRMTGRAPETPEGGGETPPEPPPHERYADDITTTPTGRWEAVVGSDLTTASAIYDRIGWQLAESQVVRPSYSFTMRRGWWQGPSHCWVGDNVLVKVYSGRLRVDTILRVHQMEFTPDPNGGEAVSVTVGAPKPDPRRRAAAVEQRLAALERR